MPQIVLNERRTNVALTFLYLPTPRVQSSNCYKNLETSRYLCIVKCHFQQCLNTLQKSPKAFQMFPTSITVCENRSNFLPHIVQFDWLISDQLRYSLNMYQLENSAIHFLFYFPFRHLEKDTLQAVVSPGLEKSLLAGYEEDEINEKFLKKAKVGISWEIWCSNQETGRSDEKLGDSRDNRESWQVYILFSTSRNILRVPEHISFLSILMVHGKAASTKSKEPKEKNTSGALSNP